MNDDSRFSTEDVAVIVEKSGGNRLAFTTWHRSPKKMAYADEDRALEKKLGVWASPVAIDSGTGEQFIDWFTMPFLAIQLRRRGYTSVPEAACAEIKVKIPWQISPASTSRKKLDVFVDLKSPYAFLAVVPTYALESDFFVELVWHFFVLNLPKSYGSAEVGDRDNKVKPGKSNRTPAQWRAVKYAYANARRFAVEGQPPLRIFGTKKIWDTRLAGIAFAFADLQGKLREFQQRLWPKFWRRELDAEDPRAICGVLESAGVDTAEFDQFANSSGVKILAYMQFQANRHGIFGVPTFVIDGDAFWGREHLPLIRRKLALAGYARRQTADILESPYLWPRNEFFDGF